MSENNDVDMTMFERAAHEINSYRARPRHAAYSEAAEQQLAALRAEVERLRVLNMDAYSAECWWKDGDTRFGSPEEYAEEMKLGLGEEFTLTAAKYWDEKFKVTKLPDESSDDVECTNTDGPSPEPTPYQDMKRRAEALERTVREQAGEIARIRGGKKA